MVGDEHKALRLFKPLFLALAVILVFVWGRYLPDSAYSELIDLQHVAFEISPSILMNYPIPALIGLLLMSVGVAPHLYLLCVSWAAWVLGCLLLHEILRKSRWWLAAFTAPLLPLFGVADLWTASFAVVAVPWCLWIIQAVCLAEYRPTGLKIGLGAVGLILCVNTAVSWLFVAVVLSIIVFRQRDWRPGVGLALLLLFSGIQLWSWPVDVELAWPFHLSAPIVIDASYVSGWLWLFGPLSLVGAIAIWARYVNGRIWMVGLAIYTILTALIIDPSAGLMFAMIGIAALSSMGVEQLWRYFYRLHDGWQIALLACVPLLIVHIGVSVDYWWARPTAVLDAELAIGGWLNAETAAEASLMASPAVGYAAGIQTLSIPASTFEAIPAVRQRVPDYLVIPNGVAAELLSFDSWFQERYEVVHALHPDDGGLIVWGYRPTVFAMGETAQPLNVRTDQGISVVGYALDESRVQPGDRVSVRLYARLLDDWSYESAELWLRLSTEDGRVLSESAVLVDTVVPDPANWINGQVMPLEVELPVPAEVDIGAYQLAYSLRPKGETDVWALYRNQDRNPLDRISLGFLRVLPQIELGQVEPVGASIGAEIQLAGYKVDESLMAEGGVLDLTLVWQAGGTPAADYVVFVHLLTADGQFVTGQDSPPVAGRFPTSAWVSGDQIVDQRLIPLDGVPRGEQYRLNIGVYITATGERLTILTADGQAVQDNSLNLTTVSLP